MQRKEFVMPFIGLLDIVKYPVGDKFFKLCMTESIPLLLVII